MPKIEFENLMSHDCHITIINVPKQSIHMPQGTKMWDREGDGAFTIKNDDHKYLAQVVKHFMKRNKEVWEKDLSSDIVPALQDKDIDFKYTYVRRLLREGGRQYLESKNILKVEKVPTGGNAKIRYKSQIYDN